MERGTATFNDGGAARGSETDGPKWGEKVESENLKAVMAQVSFVAYRLTHRPRRPR